MYIFHLISNKRQQKLTSVQTIKIYPTNFKSNQQKRTYDGKSNKRRVVEWYLYHFYFYKLFCLFLFAVVQWSVMKISYKLYITLFFLLLFSHFNHETDVGHFHLYSLKSKLTYFLYSLWMCQLKLLSSQLYHKGSHLVCWKYDSPL